MNPKALRNDVGTMSFIYDMLQLLQCGNLMLLLSTVRLLEIFPGFPDSLPLPVHGHMQATSAADFWQLRLTATA